MNTAELLTKFANPDVIQTLSTSDKLYAGLATTILGMGITFSALVILQFVIAFMDKLLNKKQKQPSPTIKAPVTPKPAPAAKAEQDDTELVAVITATIAMKLKTSVSNIVIRNIEKTEDQSPAWNRAGIIDQMNNRL
jgi:sodium pump decarboxylase gamma subunit